jgi:hypothetical protein
MDDMAMARGDPGATITTRDIEDQTIEPRLTEFRSGWPAVLATWPPRHTRPDTPAQGTIGWGWR